MRSMCAAGLAALVTCGVAWAEADGPDAWRVVDVGAGDALNMRMGPGTQYPVIGEFSHDARGLLQVTCVPLMTPEHYFRMSEAERAALPPRWCLMQSPDYSRKGWVAQRFLEPDYGAERVPPAATEDIADKAERLVRRLYDDHLRALSDSFTGPLHPARAGAFFAAPLVAAIARGELEAGPLFDAQDSDVTDLRVALDEAQPMYRGLITVNVDFRNFGQPRRAIVRLRAQNGEPRVIRVEHEAWSFQ
ncbi:SH3 domain-containing protein [Afifella pfennigii]|uniref:SH3 domain-containing protein n=1 Tax=Afifella pfennigii TaxID=209897 RepID=UPI0012EC5A89|nr:hypothetical protein [Afifella pfennigii]